MNKYTVLTSALGHEGQIDEVETDLPLDQFKIIDYKYGMKYRHQYTLIEQLKDFIDSIKYVELKDTIPFVMMDINKLPKGRDFDIDKIIFEFKKQPTQIIQSKPSLKEFIKEFVRPNTLIRIWKESKGGHTCLFPTDMVEMEWRIVKGEGIYKGLKDNPVIGVTDIVVKSIYPEAVNIVIQ